MSQGGRWGCWREVKCRRRMRMFRSASALRRESRSGPWADDGKLVRACVRADDGNSPSGTFQWSSRPASFTSLHAYHRNNHLWQ